MTCSVDGCGEPIKARGYCNSHYARWKRGAVIDTPLRNRVHGRDSTCTVEGCEKPEKGLGYCQTHLQRFKRHGSTDFRPRHTNGPIRPCSRLGCDRPLYYGGLCQKHMARQRKAQERGLTIEAYETLVAQQNGLCAICDQPERAKAPESGELRDLAIDHCHDQGIVRGLLCSHCNRGIGLFGDNPDVMRKAAAYVERFKLCDLV